MALISYQPAGWCSAGNEDTDLDKKALQDHLEQLAGAIDNMEASSAEKARLQALIDNIEAQLEDPLISDDDSQNFSDQIDDLVSSFETEHPTVAGILNNIMVTLSSMGI